MANKKDIKKELKIIKLKLEEIKQYWRNPRIIDKAVEKVKESIKKYGFNNPILIDKENVIISGHTRYKALKDLKYKEASCIILDLSPDKAKQFRIIDNKTSEEAKWNNELLMFEMREIEDLNDISSFFSEKELKNLDIELEGIEEEFKEIEIEIIKEKEIEMEIKENEIKSKEQKLNEIEKELESDKLQNEAEKEVLEKEKAKIEKEKAKIEKENKKIEEELEKIKKKETKQYEEKSKSIQNDYIEIICPHCEESYTLSRTKILQSEKIHGKIQ